VGWGGGQRFVTKLFKNIGICTVLRYEGGEEGQKSWEIALRIIWTTPNKYFTDMVLKLKDNFKSLNYLTKNKNKSIFVSYSHF
jgi:hypothetical protein